jgi:hypothetical protein
VLLRLIQVFLLLFFVMILVRFLRAATRKEIRGARPRTSLDPRKEVSAAWTEVPADREGGQD